MISRTIYFPYGLMVRADLDVKSIAELRGKTIGVPFGSGPQPTLYTWLASAGLRIGENVTVINLPPNEMSEAISSKRVDAIMTWEPNMTVLEKQGKVRSLKEAKGVGFMCMSSDYLRKYPDVADRFVKAWKDALLYASTHRPETDAWFAEDSRYPVDLLKSIRVVDPNLDARSIGDIEVRLSLQDIDQNQLKADFAARQGLIPPGLNLRTRVSTQD